MKYLLCRTLVFCLSFYSAEGMAKRVFMANLGVSGSVEAKLGVVDLATKALVEEAGRVKSMSNRHHEDSELKELLLALKGLESINYLYSQFGKKIFSHLRYVLKLNDIINEKGLLPLLESFLCPVELEVEDVEVDLSTLVRQELEAIANKLDIQEAKNLLQSSAVGNWLKARSEKVLLKDSRRPLPYATYIKALIAKILCQVVRLALEHARAMQKKAQERRVPLQEVELGIREVELQFNRLRISLERMITLYGEHLKIAIDAQYTAIEKTKELKDLAGAQQNLPMAHRMKLSLQLGDLRKDLSVYLVNFRTYVDSVITYKERVLRKDSETIEIKRLDSSLTVSLFKDQEFDARFKESLRPIIDFEGFLPFISYFRDTLHDYVVCNLDKGKKWELTVAAFFWQKERTRLKKMNCHVRRPGDIFSREFDIELDGLLCECKNLDWALYCSEEDTKLEKPRNKILKQFLDQSGIAVQIEAFSKQKCEFILFSATPIPDCVFNWLVARKIRFVDPAHKEGFEGLF